MGTARRTRFALWILSTAAVVAVLELISFAVLSLSCGEVVSWGDLATMRQLQRTAAGAAPGEQARTAEDAEQERLERWREYRIVVPKTLHPYLGYVTDPEEHRRIFGRILDEEAADFGFPQNDSSLFLEADPSRVMVVVLGGSFADQLANSSGLLEPALNSVERFAGRQVEVISLALPGYKQPQQLMALNYFMSLGMHADVVVNIDGFNDVALAPVSVIPWGGFPYFPRGWPAAVGDLDPFLRRSMGELSYLRHLRARRAEAFSAAPWRYSMVCGLLWSRLDRVLGSRIADLELAVLGAGDLADTSFQARGPRRTYASADAMYQDLAAVWARCSEQMSVLCTGLGTEYHHFLQPNQYFPGSKPLSRFERRRAWKADHPYREAVERGYPLLRASGAALRQRGIAFHDLSMLFAHQEETLYRDACCHLNRSGQAQVAEAVANIVGASPAPADQPSKNPS